MWGRSSFRDAGAAILDLHVQLAGARNLRGEGDAAPRWPVLGRVVHQDQHGLSDALRVDLQAPLAFQVGLQLRAAFADQDLRPPRKFRQEGCCGHGLAVQREIGRASCRERV